MDEPSKLHPVQAISGGVVTDVKVAKGLGCEFEGLAVTHARQPANRHSHIQALAWQHCHHSQPIQWDGPLYEGLTI